jgi:general secretion pathway protein G
MSHQPASPSLDRGSSGCAVGLIIALVVAGLLLLVLFVAVVAWFGFRSVRADARVEAARTQAKMLGSAVEVYQVDTGALPPDLDALLKAPADATAAQKWNGPYLHMSAPLDPWGRPFHYEVLDPKNFSIWSSGPDGITPSPDDVHGLR